MNCVTTLLSELKLSAGAGHIKEKDADKNVELWTIENQPSSSWHDNYSLIRESNPDQNKGVATLGRTKKDLGHILTSS